MAQRIPHAHSLACEKYKTGDDFEVWVEQFEKAVAIAHQVDDGQVKDDLCKKWISLKLDETALISYRGVDPNLPWPGLKAKLLEVFADPQEKYDWHSGNQTIVWDGKESFHALATRIRLKVERNSLGANRAEECFFRFRGALPPKYQEAIDLGCGDQWDLEKAKQIAGRCRLAISNAQANAQAQAQAAGKTVSFTGASMSDDRIKSLEMMMQGVLLRVDNCEETNKQQDARITENASSRAITSQSHTRDDRRADSRDRFQRNDSRD